MLSFHVSKRQRQSFYKYRALCSQSAPNRSPQLARICICRNFSPSLAFRNIFAFFLFSRSPLFTFRPAHGVSFFSERSPRRQSQSVDWARGTFLNKKVWRQVQNLLTPHKECVKSVVETDSASLQQVVSALRTKMHGLKADSLATIFAISDSSQLCEPGTEQVRQFLRAWTAVQTYAASDDVWVSFFHTACTEGSLRDISEGEYIFAEHPDEKEGSHEEHCLAVSSRNYKSAGFPSLYCMRWQLHAGPPFSRCPACSCSQNKHVTCE